MFNGFANLFFFFNLSHMKLSGQHLLSRTSYLCVRLILNSSNVSMFFFFIKKHNRKNDFRKNSCIFRSADDNRNEDYRSYLQNPKWPWRDLFVCGYFQLKVISTYANVRRLAQLHFFWNYQPRSRVLRTILEKDSHMNDLRL